MIGDEHRRRREVFRAMREAIRDLRRIGLLHLFSKAELRVLLLEIAAQRRRHQAR